MDKFAFRYSRWQVWNDFLSLSAISLANVVPTPEKQEREENYRSIINSYREMVKHFCNITTEQISSFRISLFKWCHISI